MNKWIIAALTVCALAIASFSQVFHVTPAKAEKEAGRSAPRWIGPYPGRWCCRFNQDRAASIPRESLPEGPVTISVERYHDVFLVNGDRIDILLTREVNRRFIDQILVKCVLVLAADDKFEARTGDLHRTITVSIDDRARQILMIARQVGRLSVVVRSQDGGMECTNPAPQSDKPIRIR